ncbi:MAG: hypothetical protein ACR2OG_04940 [Gemmatimonadaceae bacterium]
MSRRSSILLTLAALTLAACDRDPASPTSGDLAHLRLLAGAASASRVDVRVDGEMKLSGLAFGQLSSAIDLAPVAPSLVFVPAGSIIDVIGRTFVLAPGKVTTVVAVDYQTLIRVMFPFPYRAESPYLRSTPGDWSVVVSHAGATDTLAMTGPIAIASGHLRTVLVLDKSGGGVQTVVTEP